MQGGRRGKRKRLSAGSFAGFLVWSKNQAHPRVMSLLQHCYHLDFKNLPKLSTPLILIEYHSINKDGALHKAGQAMFAKKTIVHFRKPTTLGFCSRLFLVPKPLNKWRPVIDLRGMGDINRYYRCQFTLNHRNT